MGTRYLSAASATQLAVLTAMLALCLNLSTGLSEHETRLYQLYGDRVFSVRAVLADSGSLYRFDQHDMMVLQDGLRDQGIAVAGLNLSYIDAREIEAAVDGVATRTHQAPTRVALVDASPLYFDIAGLPLGLHSPGSAVLTPSEDYARGQYTYTQAGSAQPCIISEDLASRHSPARSAWVTASQTQSLESTAGPARTPLTAPLGSHPRSIRSAEADRRSESGHLPHRTHRCRQCSQYCSRHTCNGRQGPYPDFLKRKLGNRHAYP